MLSRLRLPLQAEMAAKSAAKSKSMNPSSAARRETCTGEA
jgi:hypothetical protein